MSVMADLAARLMEAVYRLNGRQFRREHFYGGRLQASGPIDEVSAAKVFCYLNGSDEFSVEEVARAFLWHTSDESSRGGTPAGSAE